MDKTIKVHDSTKEILNNKKKELRLESLDAAIMWFVEKSNDNKLVIKG